MCWHHYLRSHSRELISRKVWKLDYRDTENFTFIGNKTSKNVNNVIIIEIRRYLKPLLQ